MKKYGYHEKLEINKCKILLFLVENYTLKTHIRYCFFTKIDNIETMQQKYNPNSLTIDKISFIYIHIYIYWTATYSRFWFCNGLETVLSVLDSLWLPHHSDLVPK